MIRVEGSGPLDARIAFIGEAPGQVEEQEGRPFVGPAGFLLWGICHDLGISRSEIYVTNVSKYRPPGNQFWRLRELIGIPSLNEQISSLKDEIDAIDPNIVVVFGNNALKALTGHDKISNWRGSLLWWHGRKLISTIHPAYILHSQADTEGGGDGAFHYWMKKLIEHDIRRAVEHSWDRDYRPPSRVIQHCKTLWDFNSFMSRQGQRDEVSVDIEAMQGTCMPGTVALSFNPHDALAIPLYPEIRGVIKSRKKNEPPKEVIKPTGLVERDQAGIWHALACVLEECDAIGANLKYDADKLLRLGMRLKVAWDVNLASHVIYPEFFKRLAFLTSIYTEEPYYKDEGKLFDPAKDDISQLLNYNGLDACVTLEIKQQQVGELRELGLLEFYTEFIHELHFLYSDMERVGFRPNEDERERLVRKYANWSAQLEVKLCGLLGYNLNVNSPVQVAKTVYQDLKLPLRGRRTPTGQPGTGEQVLSALLINVAKKEEHKQVLELILQKRAIDKQLGPQYLTCKADYNGKIKSTWNISGTENGRTSSSQLKAPIRPEKLGISFQTFTKHGEIGGDIRSFLCPDPGLYLVQIDSAQAEARVCFVLGRDWETLKLVDEVDIHALTASWVFGGTWEDHSKKRNNGEETPERFIGKTTRHAGHLDIRKGEFARNVTADARKYGISLGLFSEWKAGKVLDIFHLQCPNVRGVFHKEVVDALERTRVLYAPPPADHLNSGRRREFFERWGRELWKEGYAFLPQSIVSDNTKAAGLAAKKLVPDIQFIGESHDSLLFQRDKEDYEEVAGIVKNCMERAIDFSKCTLSRDYKLVIPAEIEVGENYKDLKKLKVKYEQLAG